MIHLQTLKALWRIYSSIARHYISSAYQQTIAVYGMSASMSRTGNCLDNAPMESFWATLKRECADAMFAVTARCPYPDLSIHDGLLQSPQMVVDSGVPDAHILRRLRHFYTQ